MQFVANFKKTAGLDNHVDGSQFDRAGGEPHTYGGGPDRLNPSANPSFEPTGGRKQKPIAKQIAVSIALGTYKEASGSRADIAKGLVTGLEKEHNMRTPEQNLEDREVERNEYIRHKKLRGKKC